MREEKSIRKRRNSPPPRSRSDNGDERRNSGARHERLRRNQKKTCMQRGKKNCGKNASFEALGGTRGSSRGSGLEN